MMKRKLLVLALGLVVCAAVLIVELKYGTYSGSSNGSTLTVVIALLVITMTLLLGQQRSRKAK